jgi:DNA invertase Pin-like site-specific DNA recombinase
MKNIKKTKDLKTAIIYTRVSSKDQLEGYSLESQDKNTRAFAEKEGLTVIKLFREEGESAKTADRTELKKMLEFARRSQGKIEKLIIYKLDRLARSKEDYYALKVIFRKFGITIQSATENIEDDPQGKLMEGMLSAMAEFDNDIRAERTVGGMKTRLMNGLWTWKAPLGYMNTKDITENRVIIPDPVKAPTVKMLFEEASKGLYTFKQLATKADKLNLRSKHGKKMFPQLVVRTLRNPLYCGRIEVPHWEISVQGKHEPLISKELFNKVQQKIRGDSPKSRKTPRSRDNPDFPLRGVGCSGCGGHISGGWTKGRHGGRYPYYACFKKGCPKRGTIKRSDMEGAFTAFLKTTTPNEEYFDALEEALKIAYKTEMGNVIKTNQMVDSEIEKLKFNKDKLLELKLKDLMSDDEFREENNKMVNRIKDLEISKEHFTEFNLENATKHAFNFLKMLPDNWKNIDVSELRVLNRILFPENLIYSYPDIKTPELSSVYKVNQQLKDKKETSVAPFRSPVMATMPTSMKSRDSRAVPIC